MPEMKSILIKAPALSNVVPCSVVVHQSKDGKIYATLINENVFLSRYGNRLTKEERLAVSKTYRQLRAVLSEKSGKKLKRA